MTKSDTRQLKGLAILMMLWLHLFSNEETVQQLDYWLMYVNGQPLVYSLTRIASACVPIYIFLGGYGLAATWKADSRLQGGRRALALMANFWLVFLVFVPLGCYVNPERYPGDGLTLLLNATAVSYSYNGAWWFLLPYVLTTLSAAYIIRHSMEGSKRQNAAWACGLGVLYIAVYLLTTLITITDVWPFPGVLTLLNFLSILFLFGMGVLAVKYGWIRRLTSRLACRPQWEIAGWLLLLCLLKMLAGASSLLGVPFILLFIPLLLVLRWPQWLHGTLAFLGRHSTNIWLIHYFYYYIWGNQIYALRYPIVIFLCLVVASLACSMVLRPVFKPLRKRIRGL